MAITKRYTNPAKLILDHLQTPFQRSNIKLLGDSITAGVGGTGYSTTGAAIPGTIYNQNVSTATCWANMLKTYIEGKYNKEHYVGVNNPNILCTANNSISEDTGTKLKFKLLINNPSATGKGIKFNFYGDHFSIIWSRTGGSGILDINVDGVKVTEFDGYGAFANSQEFLVTGLSAGNHSVEIMETGRKNASSTGRDIYFEGFKIPKTAQVLNYGISGIDSQWGYEQRTSLIETTDDIVIMQLGTNDRHVFVSPESSKSFQRDIVKQAISTGKKVVLMSANPVAVANDADVIRNFHMEDVDNAISHLASEFGIHFISNYKGILGYCDEKGITVDSLLGDGLHPNDSGYTAMYKNIMKGLGVPIKRDGATW